MTGEQSKTHRKEHEKSTGTAEHDLPTPRCSAVLPGINVAPTQESLPPPPYPGNLDSSRRPRDRDDSFKFLRRVCALRPSIRASSVSSYRGQQRGSMPREVALRATEIASVRSNKIVRWDGRAAHCACLESRCPRGLLGSNPSPTAFAPSTGTLRASNETSYCPCINSRSRVEKHRALSQ